MPAVIGSDSGLITCLQYISSMFAVDYYIHQYHAKVNGLIQQTGHFKTNFYRLY